MAEREPLGSVTGSLRAAAAAVEKNRAAITDLELKAEKYRQKAEADSTVGDRAAQKQKVARSETASAAEAESSAIERGNRAVAADTAATDANTGAQQRNALARREAAAAAREQAAAEAAQERFSVQRIATGAPSKKYPGQTVTSPRYRAVGDQGFEDSYYYATKAKAEARARSLEASRPFLAGALTPQQLAEQDAATTVGSLPSVTASTGRAAQIVTDATALKQARRAEADAAKQAEEERVAAEKAANARVLEDQKAFAASYGAQAEQTRTRVGRQALGDNAAFEGQQRAAPFFSGRGGGGGGVPPVALGGAGGAGGEGPPKLGGIGAEEEALAERLAKSQTEVREVFNRSGATLAAYSTQLQRHGALTSEFIQGLARGEVTIKEFESQMLTTIGKFGGWAVAGGLVYGAYETIKLFGRGIADTQTSVEQLKRSLGENVNVSEAEAGFRRVSKEVNVPIAEVGRAQFFAARAFPNQKESLEVARTALATSKLDEIGGEDASRYYGSIAVNFKLNAKEIASIFDILDVGQQKFNARIQQTLPQMARAAAAYVNAGGSAKHLAEQLIELNRITVSGGTGGGNPATAITREPANLAKAATEETLRRYGFDPKFAQEHIDEFNRQLQQRASIAPGQPGALGKTAEEVKASVKTIADNVFSPALGQRYGIPFINAGPTGLAGAVEEAAAKSRGSAQEDLNHKLSQFDERVKSLGVTLENIGSEVGSAGLGNLATDAVTGLSLLEKGLGYTIQPLAAVGQLFTGLPGPLREIGEAFLVVKAGLAVARSERGLAARGVVSNLAGVYGGGSAAEVLGAQRTQREIDARVQRLAEQQTDKLFSASFATSAAFEQAKAYEKPAAEVAALSPQARANYQEKLDALNQAAIDKRAALEPLEAQQLAAQRELTRSTQLLAVLTDRSYGTQAKLAAYRDAGGYIAQGGFPNRNPLLAPTPSAAEAEARRAFVVDSAGSATVVGQSTAVAAAQAKAAEDARVAATAQQRAAAVGAAAEAGAATEQQAAAYAQSAAAAVEAAAASATAAAQVEAAAAMETAAAESTAAASVGNLALAAGYKAQQIGAAIGGLGAKLGDFFAGLGPLGAAITGFLAFEGLSDVLGVPGDIKGRQGRVKGLAEPKSEADAVKKLADERKRLAPVVNYEETGLERLKYGVEESRALLDKGLAKVPVIGSFLAGPETRAHDEVAKEIAAAKKLQKQLNKGELKDLGSGLGDGSLAIVASQYSTYAEAILKEGKAGEEAGTKVQGLNKHLADQLALFGNASYGKEAGRELATGSGQLLREALNHPDKPQIVADASTAVSGSLSAFTSALQKTTKREAQFAKTTQQRQEVITRAEASAKEFTTQLTASAKNDLTENLETKESQLFNKERKALGTGNTKQRSKLEAEAKTLKAQIEQAHQGLLNLANITNDAVQTLAEAMSQVVEGVVIKGIQARTKLAQARAGGNQALKEKIGAKGEQEALKATEEFNPQDKPYLNAERKAKAIETREKQVTGTGFDKVKREAQERALGAGPGQTEKAKSAAQSAREELAYEEEHKHEFGPEKVAEASLKLRQAEKAISESTISESKQLTALNTQIAEARDEGNAEAQAADAAAGAAAEAAEAKTPAEQRQAALNAIKAGNEAVKARLAHIGALGELTESREPNDFEKTATRIKTLKQQIPLAQHDEKSKLRAQLTNEERKYHEDQRSEVESEIDSRLKLHEISPAQAVSQLQRLYDKAKKDHASAKVLRDLKNKIYEEETNSIQELVVGNIRLPTYFGARTLTAVNQARAGLGNSGSYGYSAIPAGIVDASTTNIYAVYNVHGAHDPEAVAGHLHKHLKTLSKSNRRTARHAR